MNGAAEVPTVDDVAVAERRAWDRGVSLEATWLCIEAVIGKAIYYHVHIPPEKFSAVIEALNKLEA